MNKSRINVDSFSCPGPKNKAQDAVLPLLNLRGKALAAIADGMGGTEGGAVASNVVIEEVKKKFSESEDTDLAKLFKNSKKKIEEIAAREPNLSNMGTTLTVCVFNDCKVYVGHVGDTRVYHIRGKGIVTRTKDQTEVQKLIDEQIINKKQARQYKRKNVLLSVISPSTNYELSITNFNIQSGDRILLLTDGVYNVVFRKEISSLSQETPNLQKFCNGIKKLVESRGAIDDYSAICIEVT